MVLIVVYTNFCFFFLALHIDVNASKEHRIEVNRTEIFLFPPENFKMSMIVTDKIVRDSRSAGNNCRKERIKFSHTHDS